MVKMNEASHRIRCGVSGLPFPSVTWRAKGQNIRQDPGRKYLVCQKIFDCILCSGLVTEVASKYEVDGTDLLIRNLNREDEGSYLCKAVQNVVGEEGVIKYSDFKDFVINLKIEREYKLHLNFSNVGPVDRSLTRPAKNIFVELREKPLKLFLIQPTIFRLMTEENAKQIIQLTIFRLMTEKNTEMQRIQFSPCIISSGDERDADS